MQRVNNDEPCRHWGLRATATVHAIATAAPCGTSCSSGGVPRCVRSQRTLAAGGTAPSTSATTGHCAAGRGQPRCHPARTGSQGIVAGWQCRAGASLESPVHAHANIMIMSAALAWFALPAGQVRCPMHGVARQPHWQPPQGVGGGGGIPLRAAPPPATSVSTLASTPASIASSATHAHAANDAP